MEKSDKTDTYGKSDADAPETGQRPSFGPEVGRRIGVVADVVGTRIAAAAAAGVSTAALQRYIRGENMPPLDVAARLCAAAGYSLEWLATGDGLDRPSADARNATDPRLLELELLPRYDVKVSGGHGADVQSEQIVDWLAFRRSFLQMIGLAAGKAALVRVVGDSMEPTVRAGDTVLIDLASSAIPRVAPTRSSPIFVVRLPGEDGLVVKRAGLVYDERMRLCCVLLSDNEGFPERRLDHAETRALTVLGRVRWSGHTFF